MAKQQDLSLNPSKLSGLCGRLKCCLRYELPNAKGVVHGGCGSEGGCDNPTRLRHRRLRLGRLRLRAAAAAAAALTSMQAAHRASPSAIPPASARRSPRKAAADPRVLAVCEPVVYAPPAGASVRAGRAERRRRARRLRRHRPRGRATRRRGAVDAIATAPINKEAFRARRAAVERPHRSAGAPDRRAARRDDVLLRRAARRAGDRSHPARRRAARADARASLEATIALTARELPRFGIVRAADRRRRPQPARRRARPVRPRRGRR